MKILIYAQNQTPDIEAQADALAFELEKAGHVVEWSKHTHPARLLMNKYDVVHILTEHMPLSLKSFLIVMTAKTLNIPLVVSSFAVESLSRQQALIANLQITYFDAMSVAEAGEVKNLRTFNQTKFLWPAWLISKTNKPAPRPINKETPICTILHVQKNFDELPEIKWVLDDHIYIDGTKLVSNKTQSEVRYLWSLFLKNRPLYKNAFLIVNKSNLEKVMAENKSVFIINYLKIQSIDLSVIIKDCLKNKTALVLSESQASGTPGFWSSNKNGLVQNFNKTFTYQLSFAEMLEKVELLQYEIFDKTIYEAKINELSRIYVKIKTQKDLKIAYANMPHRS